MIRLASMAVAAALSWPALAQQGAEACKPIPRGIDRLECFDKAYGVERKLAEPIPAVRVKSVTITREPAPEQPTAEPKP